VHLVGTGFGGWVAAEMAAAHQARCRTLTLVGAAGMRPPAGFIHDPMMESWEDYVRRGFSSDAAFESFFGASPDPILVDLWDRSREATARVTWKPWMWSLQLPQLLRAVATPTLLVWGGDDRIVPVACAERYHEALARSSVEVIPGAGHLVDIEHPDLVAGLVEALFGTQRIGTH
jgi:pimeloyl-ACP methyl ester carboxylesterase